MGTDVRFGVSMPCRGESAEMVQLGVDLEAAGWDGYFLWDHIILGPGALAPTSDPWVLLGAIAARTSRIRLGTLITPVPRRRPWKLAKEVVTLDQISGGRAILGVGLGAPPREYSNFGESTDRKRHSAMLDEALPLLDGFMRGEPVKHHGEYYQVDARLEPAAIQRPRPPIWVSATVPFRGRLEQRVRRWDGIIPGSATGSFEPVDLTRLLTDLDPRPGYDVVMGMGPARTPERAAELAEAGATWVMDGFTGPYVPFEETCDRLRAGPPRG